MRELKFRVWDRKETEWLALGATGIDCSNGKLVDYEYEGVTKANQENYIVEQFTGLKDKNGKEIYEGDILDVSSVFVKPKKMIVNFSEMACGFEPFANGCPDCYFPVGKDVEVIGNIHENPELLEEGE